MRCGARGGSQGASPKDPLRWVIHHQLERADGKLVVLKAVLAVGHDVFVDHTALRGHDRDAEPAEGVRDDEDVVNVAVLELELMAGAVDAVRRVGLDAHWFSVVVC